MMGGMNDWQEDVGRGKTVASRCYIYQTKEEKKHQHIRINGLSWLSLLPVSTNVPLRNMKGGGRGGGSRSLGMDYICYIHTMGNN